MTEPRPTLSQALDAALDAAASKVGTAPGTIEAAAGGATVVAEVVDVDRLGVVVDRLRINIGPGDLVHRSKRVSECVRPGGADLHAIELDTRLGGGVLRTKPLEDDRFYELGLDETGGVLTRHHLDSDGRRCAEPFTVTRESLGRLVDELSDSLES